MTSQGSPLSVLRRAIRGGSLGAIEMALIDLPQVDLQDGLEIILLMAKADDERFDRWASRWTDRASAEERERVQTLFERLPDEAAAAALRERAKALGRAGNSTRLHVG